MTFAFSVSSNTVVLAQSGTDTNLSGIATAISAVATVARSTAYTTSQLIKPPTPTGFWYRCSTAGTTAATAPTYGTADAGTTTDGTAVFTAFYAPYAYSLGTQINYYMPGVQLSVNGTLTNTNPAQATIAARNLIIYNGSFTSGAWASDGVTPLYDGVHFTALRTDSLNGSDNTSGSIDVQGTGAYTFIGGEVQLSGAVGHAVGSTPRAYYTRWRNSRQWTAPTSTRIRSYSANTVWRSCEMYDVAFDRFASPAEFSVVARKSEYVVQYVGSTHSGTNSKFVASSLQNIDGTYAFDNYDAGWCELYNCAQGAALPVTTQNPTTAFKQAFCVPLFQDVSIVAKDTSGVAVQNVRFICTDIPANSPATVITTYDGLKAWDFRTALTYQTTSNASGIATTSPCLNVWYWNTTFQTNLRFPSSTATVKGRAYNYKTMIASLVLGSSAAQSLSAGMVSLDTPTTVTEAVAGALTGITLTPSGATGGSLVISVNRSLQDVWNFYRYWISQFANVASSDTWTCVGGVLNTGAWSITNNTGITLSGVAAINSVVTTSSLINNGTLTAGLTASSINTATALNNSTVVGNIDQATPTDITGIKLTGNLTFNTNIPVTITLTNCTISGTISNSGTALVTAINDNSTISTIGTNIDQQRKANLSLTGLGSGSAIYVHNSGGQIAYVASSGTTYNLNVTGGTGIWTWKVVKYGYTTQTGTFIPANGGTFSALVVLLPDAKTSESSASVVAAYTEFSTVDQLYDYAGYWETTNAGIVHDREAISVGTTVSFNSLNLDFNANASSLWTYSAGTLTAKCSTLAAGTVFSQIDTTGIITYLSGSKATCLYTDASGSSSNLNFSNL